MNYKQLKKYKYFNLDFIEKLNYKLSTLYHNYVFFFLFLTYVHFANSIAASCATFIFLRLYYRHKLFGS